MIRQNKTLKGINIFGKEFRISQYADDTSVFLDGSESSLREVLDLLDYFYQMSGLKVNIEKTNVIWIGVKAGSLERFCEEHKQEP